MQLAHMEIQLHRRFREAYLAPARRQKVQFSPAICAYRAIDFPEGNKGRSLDSRANLFKCFVVSSENEASFFCDP